MATKKAPAKKSPVKKAAVKKAAPKKSAPRSAVAKKAAPKKAVAKKSIVKKVASKKTIAKKGSPKKAAVTNGGGVKKAAPKKTAPKKVVAVKTHKAPQPKPVSNETVEKSVHPQNVVNAVSDENNGLNPGVRSEDPLQAFDKHSFQKATTKGDPHSKLHLSSTGKKPIRPSGKKPLWNK